MNELTIVNKDFLSELEKYQNIISNGNKADLKAAKSGCLRLEKSLKEIKVNEIGDLEIQVKEIKEKYKPLELEVKKAKEHIAILVKEVEAKEKEEKRIK